MSEVQEESAPVAAVPPSTNKIGEGGDHGTLERKTASAEPSAPEESPSTVKEDETEAPPAAAPTKPGPRLCGVCSTEAAKYKCPRCTLPYCSVACNRVHKETHPADEPLPKPAAPPPPPQPQEPLDPYSILLDHRSEFDRLFKKYPLLPSQLLEISAATLDPDAPAANTSTSTNTNPIYQQAQEALRAATAGMDGRGKKQDVWTREVGLRTGASALREARTDPGDKGDGVREFCDLVLYLLSKRDEEEEGRGEFEDLGWNKGQKRKWEGGGVGRLNSAVDMAREAAIKEDREVMRKLNEEEGYERELKQLGIR